MSHVGPVRCPILIGRDDLLEALDRAIADALAGCGRTVFLSGQAGIGKTRLLLAVERQADVAGLRLVGGVVAPQDHQVPFASIRDLRELAPALRGGPAFGSLSAELQALDGPHQGDALGARRLIIRATSDRILDAIDRPTLLVFRDLHWTDELSLEVIGELARRASERPLLVVGDYRADDFPPRSIHPEWRARLLTQRHADEMRLRPLTIDETAIATTLILGGELPAPRDVVEAVYQRTNGIPLHIEELLAALDEQGRTDGRRIREANVPDTIGDAVLARLGRLSDDARTVARAGAVIGRCFSPAVLAGVLDRPLAQLEPALEELAEAAIVHRFHYIDQGYYDFRHQLLRDTIYASVPPSQLRRFHAQAAEFVMALEAASIVHVSRHYERAGLRSQAFRASMTAAADASRFSAGQEAYELFQRAVANMPVDLPVSEQAELFERFADAAGAVERDDDCLAAATRARELYLAAGRPLEAARCLVTLSMLAARSGRPSQEARSYDRQALEEIVVLPVTPERERTRAAVAAALANDDLLASALPAARSGALEARQLAMAFADQKVFLESDLLLARIDIVEGRCEAGLTEGMRAAHEAREAGFESVSVAGFRELAILATRTMFPRTAEAAVEEGLRSADAIEQSHSRQMISTTRSTLDWSEGRWDAADERARQELVELGCRRGVLGSLDVIGLVALGRGRMLEARRWLEESLASGLRIGEVQFILTPLWGLAEADLLDGAWESAIARCDEGRAVAHDAGERALLVPFVVTAVRGLIAACRPDAAARWATQARDDLRDWEPVAGHAIEHAEGLVRLASGSLAAARASLERAVRGWDGRGRVWEANWARLDLAQCLSRSHRLAEATSVLALVGTMASTLGSAPLLTRVEDLGKQVRGGRPHAEPWRPLTVREFEVARLVANGLTNAEIAAELSLSPRTVSAHLEHILAKLGVSRRAEVAAWTAAITTPATGVATHGADATALAR